MYEEELKTNKQKEHREESIDLLKDRLSNELQREHFQSFGQRRFMNRKK